MLNNLKVVVVLIVSAMILNACESAPGSEELYKEVMKYHDEAMPHMGALYKAVKKTEEKISNLDSLASDDVSKELESQLETFKSARASMQQWMRDFGSNYNKDLPEAEQVKILKDELIKVKEMSKEMMDAVELSKKI